MRLEIFDTTGVDFSVRQNCVMQVGCRPPKNKMKSGAKIRPVVRTLDYIVQATLIPQSPSVTAPLGRGPLKAEFKASSPRRRWHVRSK